ncbi:MAG: DUF4349 domain-containing protein [Halobacteriaceae archaeon]
MSPTRQSALAVCTALLVVLAGCGGAGSGDGGGAAMTTAATDLADEEAAPERESGYTGDGDGGDGAGESEGGDSAESAASIRDRKLVRTGTVRLRVDEFENASEEVRALARRHGGFVGDTRKQTNTEPVNETTTLRWTEGRLVVRVPAENFSRVFERVQQLGEVRAAASNTEDVTGKLVDLEARLRNLRAQRERLRGLYEQANETEDVLRVEDRLSAVQAEIERLAARRAALRDRVAFSTITVEMSEPTPEFPETTSTEPAWYEVGLVAAFLDSVSGAATALRALAVLAAYAAPYAAVFGVPLAAVGYLWRRSRRSGDGNGDTGSDGDDTAGETGGNGGR